jgi:hypothetical protein
MVEWQLPLILFIVKFAFELWYFEQFQLFSIVLETTLSNNYYEIIYIF